MFYSDRNETFEWNNYFLVYLHSKFDQESPSCYSCTSDALLASGDAVNAEALKGTTKAALLYQGLIDNLIVPKKQRELQFESPSQISSTYNENCLLKMA